MRSSISPDEKVALVRGLTLFSDVSQDESNEIISGAREQRWWRWQTIRSASDPVENVMLLLSGCVKITQLDLSGNEVILRLSGAGELLGGYHLPANGNHFSTAQAIQSSTGFLWKRSDFEHFLDKFPVFRHNAVRALEQRLHEMEERFREVSTLSVSSRLSSELIRLLERFDVNGKKEIQISQKDLAQLTGMTLFTVSRLLGRWQRSAIVSIGRGSLRIRDIGALAQLSQTNE